MHEMMRTWPQMPLLTMEDAMGVIVGVDMPNTVIATTTGYTRMQALRWRKGDYKRPHPTSREAVSALAYKVLRAIRAARVPTNPLNQAFWRRALDDQHYPIPMTAMSPHDLLPPELVEKYQPAPSTDDAAA